MLDRDLYLRGRQALATELLKQIPQPWGVVNLKQALKTLKWMRGYLAEEFEQKAAERVDA